MAFRRDRKPIKEQANGIANSDNKESRSARGHKSLAAERDRNKPIRGKELKGVEPVDKETETEREDSEEDIRNRRAIDIEQGGMIKSIRQGNDISEGGLRAKVTSEE